MDTASYLLFDCVNTATRTSELPNCSINNNRQTFWGLNEKIGATVSNISVRQRSFLIGVYYGI